MRIEFSQSDTENIIHDYTVQKLSTIKISKKFDVCTSTIAKVLKQNGVIMRSPNDYKSKLFNEHFFDVIDDEEKAYWLGFVYADGCVSQYNTQDCFEVKLSIDDIEHLQKLKASLCSEHQIGVYTSKNGYNAGQQYCSFSIRSQYLVNSLKSKGVVYNKTKVLQFPSEDVVPLHLLNHFIRGYFDGDGSVYDNKNKRQKTTTRIVSFTGSKDMLEGILFHLKVITGTQANIYKYKNKDIYDLKIGGNVQVDKIYHYFYDNASIFLGRKKDRFMKD